MKLVELQHAMAEAVMQPLTSSYTMRKRAPDGASVAHKAASFIKPNQKLSSFERLEIYNRQYWFRILSCFAEDCVVSGLNGAPSETSRTGIRARYASAFAQFPQNKAELKNRIAVGNTVVDHELVVRAPGGEEFEIVAIYTFKDGLIGRVAFAK